MEASATRTQQMARFLAFPSVFSTALAVTWWGLTAGYSPSMVLFLTTSLAAVVITGLERWIPFESSWSRSCGDVPTDLFYAVSSLFAAPRLFDILALTALLELARLLPLGVGVWPVLLPWGVQLVFAVLVAEFGS